MNLKSLTSLYSPRFPARVTYMLQMSEYQTAPYLKWLWRTRDFSTVAKRRALNRTVKAKMLELSLTIGMLAEIAAGIFLIVHGALSNQAWSWEIGGALLIAYPLIWPYLVIVPLELGRALVVAPNENRAVSKASATFASHSAVKIAVAGSYGKTTMKEILKTVLGEGKTVAVTVANKNVAIEHARLASRLKGDEEVLVIEYGEGAPGDVERFAYSTSPTYGVITGLAPAHLDKYKSVAEAGRDIFALATYLKGKNVYLNGESPAAKPFVRSSFKLYSAKGVGNWKTGDVKSSIEGVSFRLADGKTTLKLESRLLGRHQIGALSAAAAIGLELGLSGAQVERGIAKTEPFEHRMQPYQLGGAWVIDDTYNGNIEGIKAGTRLLAELPARRKIYVTPGLVDQGEETEAVHLEMGRAIAAAKPDLVVLMKNSACEVIKRGLDQAKFRGEIQVADDPKRFYSDLESMLAKDDLALLQNDWTDNYA